MNQTIGGGLSGGSAIRAEGNVATDAGACAAVLVNCTVNVESAAADPVQALKHAATPVVPSGQHGQGLESSACGMESAQGISLAGDVSVPARAVATGADSSTCPSTSR
jgi:hypothetical protein